MRNGKIDQEKGRAGIKFTEVVRVCLRWARKDEGDLKGNGEFG